MSLDENHNLLEQVFSYFQGFPFTQTSARKRQCQGLNLPQICQIDQTTFTIALHGSEGGYGHMQFAKLND